MATRRVLRPYLVEFMLNHVGQPVTLEQIKAEPGLAQMVLLRQSRLSVQPVRKAEFERKKIPGVERINLRDYLA